MTLHEIRTARELTQSDLAEAMGVSKQMVSQWEKSDNPPTGTTLINLAVALDAKITITKDGVNYQPRVPIKAKA